MTTAWDQLLDLIDHVAAGVASDGPELEPTLARLCTEAMAVGDIDRELHVPDVTRWIAGLMAAHTVVRERHPEVDPDTDLADLRLIVTRWLHPGRPR